MFCHTGLQPIAAEISSYMNDLHKILKYVPLAGRARMGYMNDGALVHFCHAVRNVLSNTYHD
jgi:hypothetical protein